MSLLRHYKLVPRNDWCGFSSATERYKARQWRIGFAIFMCLLAILCICAAVQP
jgi:hypothetical protein